MLKIDNHDMDEFITAKMNTKKVLAIPASFLLLFPLSMVTWHQWLR